VRNRSPSSAIQGDLPYELLYGQKVISLEHLRVLGSRVMMRDPKPANKLDARARVCYLVGYKSDGRGKTAVYRVMDAETRDVHDVGDVTFDERPPGQLSPDPSQSNHQPAGTGSLPTPQRSAVRPDAERSGSAVDAPCTLTPDGSGGRWQWALLCPTR
jgi:hypothetical protein